MRFTERLKTVARPIWEATVQHPMVVGLGEGTLAEAPFKHWVAQDYVFLIEYSRTFALGSAKAPRLEHMAALAKLLHETLNTEMDLHRSYAKKFGLSNPDLEATRPSPTTQAYTDFLVRTASLGSWAELIAALLPCMWGFYDTGSRLAKKGLPDHAPYAEWIKMYSGKEFGELTQWCIRLMDEAASGASPAVHDHLEHVFLTSARYEYQFWDAAWRQEAWPV